MSYLTNLPDERLNEKAAIGCGWVQLSGEEANRLKLPLGIWRHPDGRHILNVPLFTTLEHIDKCYEYFLPEIYKRGFAVEAYHSLAMGDTFCITIPIGQMIEAGDSPVRKPGQRHYGSDRGNPARAFTIAFLEFMRAQEDE